MSKVIVISERGKLVGTWVPPQEPPDPHGPVARVVAGRGQKLHQIEIPDAEVLHQKGKTGELARLVKKKLKLK